VVGVLNILECKGETGEGSGPHGSDGATRANEKIGDNRRSKTAYEKRRRAACGPCVEGPLMETW